MMDVKSKIASFEAHNERVRSATTPPGSPRGINNRDDDFDAPGSPVLSDTATSVASQNRKVRLQRLVNGSNSNNEQPKPEHGALKERRIARQQDLRQRLEQNPTTATTTTKTSTNKAARSTSSKTANITKKVEGPSSSRSTAATSRGPTSSDGTAAAASRRDSVSTTSTAALRSVANSTAGARSVPGTASSSRSVASTAASSKSVPATAASSRSVPATAASARSVASAAASASVPATSASTRSARRSSTSSAPATTASTRSARRGSASSAPATTATSSSKTPLDQKHQTATEVRKSQRRAKMEKAKAHSPRAAAARRRQQQPSPEQPRVVAEGNRRMVHSISMESDSGSREVEAARQRRNARMRASKSKSPPIMSESDTYFNQLLAATADDDNTTQASLRQVMMMRTTTQEEKECVMSSSATRSVSAKASVSSNGIISPGVTRASSSSFDTEGDGSSQLVRSVVMSRSISAGSGHVLSHQDFPQTDDDSQASVTFEQRKEMERKAREAKLRGDGYMDNVTSPLLNKEDMEFFGRHVDSPVAKTAAGVIVAGSVGCLLMGPVGLLVGAAAVGLGVGIMQIPEEQRQNVQDKATKAVKRAHDSAVAASEKLSTSCATSCHETGMADAIPNDLKMCFTPPDALSEADGDGIKADDDRGQDENRKSKRADNSKRNAGKKNSTTKNVVETKKVSSPTTHASFGGKRRAAVLRHGHITPLNEIYSLAPSLQPRAWLDVMASANTTMDEKNEAMEEINILAKDKRRAQILLDEGILDSIMWILTGYLEAGPQGPDAERELAHAKLAATCCVTLGKAHCAAVHTGGDLLLMSMYDRGTVPEARQLAQMLYEVPHHVQIAKSSTEDAFVLKHISMPQAEELASSITSLANVGKNATHL